MKRYVYVLVEIEVSKDCPDGVSYCEVFDSLSNAQNRMRDLYHSNVVEKEDLVASSGISERHAYGSMKSGMDLQWDITMQEIR